MKRRLSISLIHALNSARNLVGVGVDMATSTGAVAGGFSGVGGNGFGIPVASLHDAHRSANGVLGNLRFHLSISPAAGLSDRLADQLSSVLLGWAGVIQMLLDVVVSASLRVATDVAQQQLERGNAFVDEFVGRDRRNFGYPITQKPFPINLAEAGGMAPI